jgi:hypothetical protein
MTWGTWKTINVTEFSRERGRYWGIRFTAQCAC